MLYLIHYFKHLLRIYYDKSFEGKAKMDKNTHFPPKETLI